MNNNLIACQCVCFLLSKKLNLPFSDSRQMAEDLNNLRGGEWQEVVDRLNDKRISDKWREWSITGRPDSPVI